MLTGVGALVPAAMHEADEPPGLKPGTGLTAVPAAGLLVLVTAGVLSRRSPPAAEAPQRG